MHVLLLRLVVAASLVAVLVTAGCDSQHSDASTRLTLATPSGSGHTDTLVIGQPFELRATATSRAGIESIEIGLAYSSAEEGRALLEETIRNPARTDTLRLDTVLTVPTTAQPSDVVGRNAYFRMTARSFEGSTAGLSVGVVLVDPAP